MFTGVDLAIDRGSKVVVLGLNGAGKTSLLLYLPGWRNLTRAAIPGHRLKLSYYAQEHETLDEGAPSGEYGWRRSGLGVHVRNILRSVSRSRVMTSINRWPFWEPLL